MSRRPEVALVGFSPDIPQIDLKTWGQKLNYCAVCIPIVGIFFSPLENSAVYFHSKVFGMCYGGF